MTRNATQNDEANEAKYRSGPRGGGFTGKEYYTCLSGSSYINRSLGCADRNTALESWRIIGPHTGHGPRNYRRPDVDITQDINDRLTQHGLIDATDVEVEVSDGKVGLRGSVDTHQTKQMVEDVVKSVFGVRHIIDRLAVRNRPA